MLRCAVVTAVLAVLVTLGMQLAGDGKVRMFYPAPKWTNADIPDLEGKIALVTGANTGLGFATALELMKHGCEVVVATRSGKKSQETLDRLLKEPSLPKQYIKKGRVLKNGLDLMSQASVKVYAEEALSTLPKLDILINNAGIMLTPFMLSEDGFESQFAVNHLGHYALTLRLMPLLEKPSTARVVTVSSTGHNMGNASGLDLMNLNNEASYDPSAAYARSKLANILFSNELARRKRSSGIFANAAHPGGVDTDLGRHVYETIARVLGGAAADAFQKTLRAVYFLTPTEGATTQLFLATATEVEAENISGEYYVPTARKAGSHPLSFDLGKSKLADDEALAKELWKFSVDKTGLDL